MVTYKKTEFKDLTGNWQAEITEVEVAENQFYDNSKENSTPEVLHISFVLIDLETWEKTPFVQKFVNPLTHGNGLFSQLLDAVGFGPDEDGGEFDEEALVGLELLVKLENNKKGYARVVEAKPLPAKRKKAEPVKEDEGVDSDLPFDEDKK